MHPIDLDALLRRLHLPTVRRLCSELETRAESESLSYRQFLALLMAEEVAHRAQTRIQRSLRKARFPFLRSIEDFDFTFQTNVRLQLLGSYLGPELVTEGRNLVLLGPSGTGKTHLAVAIGYPDLVQIFMGTVLNQTGQAIEVVVITMAVYLTISLATSFVMNIYNRRVAIVER